MTKILVPIDGSGESHAALPYALRMARSLEAEIVLLGVMERPYLEESESEPAQRALVEHLERLRAAFEAMGAPISLLTGKGTPADEIVRLSEEISADLIVMSAYGRRGGGRWLLGGVTARVVRGASCPVLVARPGEHRPGEEHRTPFRHILLPLDGSPFSERALDAAAMLAERDEARLCLLGVVDFPTWLCYQTEEKWSRRLPTETESYLAARSEPLKARKLHSYCQVCVGDPAEQILQAAENGVDLIVMATHGYSGLARTIMGSVAERVMQHARCPVLFIRQHQGAVASPAAR